MGSEPRGALGGWCRPRQRLLILAFFAFIVVEVVSTLNYGVLSSNSFMLGLGAIALMANLVCLTLLRRFSAFSINMRSTFECLRSGVLVAAVWVLIISITREIELTSSLAGLSFLNGM